MKKTSLWPFILLPILLVAAGIWGDSRGRIAGEAVPVATRAGARLAALETEVSGFNDRLATLWLANATGQAFDPAIPGEVTALIFRKDTLAWWSGTAVQPEEALSAVREIRQLLRTGNGFYRLFHIEKGGSHIISALRLRSEYPFQNKYLVNSFHPALEIPEGFVMSLEPGRGAAVQGLKGTEFYVEPSASGMIPGASWPALCYLLGAAALLILAFKAVKLRTGKTHLAWYLTGALVLILRYGGAYFEIPESVQSLSFFSPANYASSLLFNSLGDLFAFALALVFVTIGLLAGRQKTTSGAVWPWILTAFILGSVVHHLISTLVLNSKISFDIGNVFELNYFTLAGVIIIGMMLFSLVMIILIAAQHSQVKGFVSSALIWTAAAALTALLPVVMPTDGWSDVTWWQMSALLLVLFALTYRMAAKRELMSGAGMVLVIIAACSAYAALTLSERNAIRERNERKLIAAKLENEQDGIAEYLFEDIAGKVQRDQTLQEYFSAPFLEQLTSYAADDPVSRRMQQVYFTGYWARYDVDVKCFSRSGLPVNAGGDPTWSLDYFESIIDEDAMPTQSRHLYYVGNNSGRLFYIARFDILPTADSLSEGGTIIVLLNSKTLHDESGFPELLISDKVPQKKDLSAYSIAEYKDGQLVSQTGRYNFLSSDSLYASHPVSSESFIEFDGHSHLIYRKAGGGLLMISIPSPGMVTYITLFSYLFAFFGTVYILVYFSARLVRFRGRIRMNFKNRIEAAVVLIVLTGMLLVGGATVYFIYMNYDANISEEVTGKLKSVQVAVSELPGLRTADSEVGEELGYSLAGISATLSSNFNIYNTGGRLVYSTQPKIYEQGIVAPLMDRRAMQELMVKGKSYHSRIERTGRLRYLSAYTQLRNANNELIGYLNLPYYARQEDLNKAVSAFMLALINIYVLLFSASLVIAFFIAGRITRPLEVIQQSLSRIRLGSRNEPIRWEHQDEIGALVREYNRMVDELAESANRLARSERESAWREMAKQVAHEIKNPLTPMKLSIQHLQRAQREQHPGLEDMVRRVSETLISQIETLTGIANEFSSFAQMPRGNSERVDLIQIVRTITDLYRESENVTVTFDPGDAPCEVFADRDQLSRVFSNLLKNSVQAIEDGKQGEIRVTVTRNDGQAVVSVTDNGIGIADDRKASLFVPNFTTKTGGTGLGLAMSKNIVEQEGGKIWFESQEGKGTTFHVELPLMK